jgi:hypothetical protein
VDLVADNVAEVAAGLKKGDTEELVLNRKKESMARPCVSVYPRSTTIFFQERPSWYL